MNANDESFMSERGLRVFPECIVHVNDVRLQCVDHLLHVCEHAGFRPVSHEDRHVHSEDSVFDVDSHQTVA